MRPANERNPDDAIHETADARHGTRCGLHQLTYLTTKSSHILDSRGTHDGKKTLTEAEINRVVRRFENQWGERHSPKLGHTSHLLMAFPVGTSGEEVRAITESVCEKLFQGEGSQFDYIAAIHQDRAHPHAHIVLNRRSKDGEMFFLGKDHHFNYDAFRAAMVEAAQVHGIRLEATRRLDRGVTTYRAEIDEVYKARDEGRPTVERQRTGADLTAALETVARNALSKTFPHALIVAPTGRGKGVGFVIPNLLTYKGSAVVLDVKGENFRETSRFRASMGDKVFRFAPTDWDRPTHRYNPLARIAAMTNPDRQQMELKLTAKLFLQTDNEKLSGLLAGGIDLFVAAGLLAFERGVPTIGEIYRITASGGDKQKEYLKRAQEVKNTSAKLIFERMASTNNDTLTSYLSLLMTSGLDTWDNRAIDAATATSDFSFRDIRRRPHAIYLVVESEMIRPLAPLIRLFFSDLIASLQAQEPGDDEPWPVMIMLDEFDRLGKMPIVAESIKTLRSFGGNLAIVTQTIPALDEIYGENTRRSLQGGAGVKLYLTPSEQKTIEELSQAVGKTTKRVITRSRAIGRNPFEGRSVSERTEDTPLLTEDQARRMDLDEVILVIDAQMPIRARRIKYFEDPALKVLHVGQAGSFPYPDEDGVRRDRQMTEKRQTVEKLKLELQEVRAAAGAQGTGTITKVANETQLPKPVPSGRARGKAARAAAGGSSSGQLSFDLARLGLKEADGRELAAAVQTTRAIIAEYA